MVRCGYIEVQGAKYVFSEFLTIFFEIFHTCTLHPKISTPPHNGIKLLQQLLLTSPAITNSAWTFIITMDKTTSSCSFNGTLSLQPHHCSVLGSKFCTHFWRFGVVRAAIFAPLLHCQIGGKFFLSPGWAISAARSPGL